MHDGIQNYPDARKRKNKSDQKNKTKENKEDGQRKENGDRSQTRMLKPNRHSGWLLHQQKDLREDMDADMRHVRGETCE